MKLFHAISLMTVIAQASAASNSSFHSELNGWYPCSNLTFGDDEGSGNQNAECAVYLAPLCYPGICEAPESVDPTVDIFVKRIPAVNDSETASNVWLIRGGPGLASTSMERSMVQIHARLNGAVNVYTMDHRGTGRSTLLDCVAAQATSTGSPSGSQVEPSEAPACAQALAKKYGDLSSFSVTSAATDLATFISNYSNGARTIVYGVSYGTILVERLIHFNLLEVTGYVLDGIATTSGAPQDEAFYASADDSHCGDVGDAFMSLCVTTSNCSERFVSKNLPTTLQDVYTQFDDSPNSTCAALVSKLGGGGSGHPASYILRRTLATLLGSARRRTLIPPVIYRLNRCGPKDIDVLTRFFTTLYPNVSSPSQVDPFYSTLLYNLIVFSEMWERPTPSTSEMTMRFTNASMADGLMYPKIPLYCAFSKEKSAVCDELGVGSYDANGIIYEVDEYWNKSATIPAQASVLLLGSKLDLATPHKYAESLLKALDGDNKELVTFEYATHGTIVSTPLSQGNETCGMNILVSYVTNNGNLELLDKSCIDEMPAFSITPRLHDQYYFLSTYNAYDGVYNGSLSW